MTHINATPEEVRAYLREIDQPGTGKAQFRTVLDPQPPKGAELGYSPFLDEWRFFLSDGTMLPIKLPHQPDGQMWVREVWTTGQHCDRWKPSEINPLQSIGYPATEDGPWLGKIRQINHMPRWASRITLTVQSVRVERLQSISEADAIAEGVNPSTSGYSYSPYGEQTPIKSYRTGFVRTYANRHGPDAWAANPVVEVATVLPELKNIDEVK